MTNRHIQDAETGSSRWDGFFLTGWWWCWLDYYRQKICHSDDYFLDKPYIYIYLYGIHVVSIFCLLMYLWGVFKGRLYECYVYSICWANLSLFYLFLVMYMSVILDFKGPVSLTYVFFLEVLCMRVCVCHYY